MAQTLNPTLNEIKIGMLRNLTHFAIYVPFRGLHLMNVEVIAFDDLLFLNGNSTRLGASKQLDTHGYALT